MNRFPSPGWLHAALALIVGFGALAWLAGVEPAWAAPSNHPKLAHRLADLADLAPREPAAVAAYARDHGLKLKNGLVQAVLVPAPSGDIDRRAVAARGATVDGSALGLVRVLVPAPRLALLADEPSVGFIRPPLTPYPLVVSEGVAATGAATFQGAGYTGAGIKVAIIDLGFSQLTQAISAGEVPTPFFTKDYTGTGLEADTQHGTAVAEVVHDMAPGAGLALMKIGDEIDLANAKNDAYAQGCDIVNHSVGWVNSSFYDGTGPISAVVDDARFNKGILWCNAAGNSAQRHWEGDLKDADGDSWHEFSGTQERDQISGSYSIAAIFLTWNDWPASNQDLDLYLVDARGFIIAASAAPQDGTQEPTEAIYTVLRGKAPWSILVKKYGVTKPLRIEIFSFYHDFQYQVPQSSLMDPANAAGATVVGAIDVANYTTGPIEYFSSWGPTNAGLIKPDLAGPDGNSSWTYNGKFYGTSSSSPHVAGAAALLLSQNPSLTADGLALKLEGDAIDMGDSGKDNVYGAGRLNLVLGGNPPPGAPTGLAASGGNAQVTLAWNANTEPDLAGYNVYRSTTSGGPYAKINGALVGTNAYLDTGVTNGTPYYYVVTAVDTAAQESGYSNQASATPQAPPAGVTVTSISPNCATPKSTITVTVTGTGFASGAALTFQGGAGPAPTASNVVVQSSTHLTATVKIKSGGPGTCRYWNVRVTNPDGGTGVLAGGFTVSPSGCPCP
jgi:subtilisin family serine protease